MEIYNYLILNNKVIDENVLQKIKNKSEVNNDTILYLPLDERKVILELKLYKTIYSSVEKVWVLNPQTSSFDDYFIMELNIEKIKSLENELNETINGCELTR